MYNVDVFLNSSGARKEHSCGDDSVVARLATNMQFGGSSPRPAKPAK